MSLDTNTLKETIKTAFLDQRSNTDDPEAAAEDLAGKIANAFEVYVKGIGINYVSGLANGSGPVTGTFVYTIT